MPLNILVVDDHPMMLAAVADLMHKVGPSVKVGFAAGLGFGFGRGGYWPARYDGL
jgi:DNA-binding NarL/FixJ family response regulator